MAANVLRGLNFNLQELMRRGIPSEVHLSPWVLSVSETWCGNVEDFVATYLAYFRLRMTQRLPQRREILAAQLSFAPQVDLQTPGGFEHFTMQDPSRGRHHQFLDEVCANLLRTRRARERQFEREPELVYRARTMMMMMAVL